MADFIPKAATDYIKNKSLKPAFSYKDVWNEEHAASFTVAKAMQLDVLSDLHNAVIGAMEKGQSFENFKKNIKPVLQQKGWWGKKEMADPLTGQTVNAQLGSDRRLKTIYRVNMRSAYQKGQYERTMESGLHPYLMYRTGPSINHRPDHASWDGLVLPKDDPWWDSHFPPNGWGCKCYTRAVTEARLKKYQAEGVAVPPSADGTGGGKLQVKTKAPPVKYKTYINERKGITEQVPEGVDPAFNWNVGKAKHAETAKQKLQEAYQNYEKTVAVKPKKEYLTQKNLQAKIADIDGQMQGIKNKKVYAGLDAKKAEYQQLLDKKMAVEQKKVLTKQSITMQKEFDSLKVKTYSGIWKDDITTADWQTKSASIQVKKNYFQNKLNAGGLSDIDKAKFEQFLKDLDEFEVEGKHYHTVQKNLKNVKNTLTSLKKGSIINIDDVFSQARKDAAVWAQTPQMADDALRKVCCDVWQKAPQAERKAIYEYTQGSGGFNRPLRGYQGNWSNFKGIGKVDLNYESKASAIKKMTDIINKSQYDVDIWLQRGNESAKGTAAFLGISENDLRKLPQGGLEQKLIKERITDQGFVSCGSTKGKGFSGYIFNIYCPKGTKMMYAEPFSQYGYGNKLKWDGKSKQSGFGYEDETIIQRGTTFRVTKIEKKGGNTYFDIEVVSQI